MNAGDTQYSAYARLVNAATRIPGGRFVTPSPTASITPAASMPGESGSRGFTVYVPWRKRVSAKFTPIAWFLIKTPPGRTSVLGMSAWVSTSGPPVCAKTTAFIVSSLAGPTVHARASSRKGKLSAGAGPGGGTRRRLFQTARNAGGGIEVASVVLEPLLHQRRLDAELPGGGVWRNRGRRSWTYDSRRDGSRSDEPGSFDASTRERHWPQTDHEISEARPLCVEAQTSRGG